MRWPAGGHGDVACERPDSFHVSRSGIPARHERRPYCAGAPPLLSAPLRTHSSQTLRQAQPLVSHALPLVLPFATLQASGQPAAISPMTVKQLPPSPNPLSSAAPVAFDHKSEARRAYREARTAIALL